jgi:hypothetical protein
VAVERACGTRIDADAAIPRASFIFRERVGGKFGIDKDRPQLNHISIGLVYQERVLAENPQSGEIMQFLRKD